MAHPAWDLLWPSVGRVTDADDVMRIYFHDAHDVLGKVPASFTF